MTQERTILTEKDVSEGKDGAYHSKNAPLAQIMATIAQASAEKGVCFAEKGVCFAEKAVCFAKKGVRSDTDGFSH